MTGVRELPPTKVVIRATRTPALLLTAIGLAIAEGFVTFAFLGSTANLVLYAGLAVLLVGLTFAFLSVLTVPQRAVISSQRLTLYYRFRTVEVPLDRISRPPLQVGPFGAIVAYKAASGGGVDTFFATRALGMEIERIRVSASSSAP